MISVLWNAWNPFINQYFICLSFSRAMLVSMDPGSQSINCPSSCPDQLSCRFGPCHPDIHHSLYYLHMLRTKKHGAVGCHFTWSFFPKILTKKTTHSSPIYGMPREFQFSWWRHQMETFSALLAICTGNLPVPIEFPTQRPVTRSFDVYFDLRPNKQFSKQWWGWWFEMPSRPLWCHRNVMWFIFCLSYCSAVSSNIMLYHRLSIHHTPQYNKAWYFMRHNNFQSKISVKLQTHER